MTIQTSPNGITTSSAENGYNVENLGALAAAGTTTMVRGLPVAGEAALADIITATRAVGADHTILLPAMPVGSRLTFQVAHAGPGAGLVIQETGADGLADNIQFQSDAGAAVNFNVAKTFNLTDEALFASGTGMDIAVATTATLQLIIEKIQPSSAATVSDGWTVVSLEALTWT